MDIRHCYVPNLPGIREVEVEKEVQKEVQKEVEKEVVVDGEEVLLENGVKGESLREIGESEEKEVVGGGKEVVIMAKHLCGVATDLALRSLEAFRRRKLDQNGENFENGKYSTSM